MNIKRDRCLLVYVRLEREAISSYYIDRDYLKMRPIFQYLWIYKGRHGPLCTHIHMYTIYVYVYVCVCVIMHVCMYAHTHIHTYI